MAYLLIGLVLFLGVHCTRVFAEGWRTALIGRIGPKAWRGAYSLVSLAGLVLLVWGYGLARQQPVLLWQPALGLRHAASLLTLLAFVLLAAAHVPGNHLKAAVGHPMVLGVKAWALGHLLSNGTLADALLFGGFLLWSVLVFRSARRRPAGAAPATPPKMLSTVLVVLIGTAVWVAFIGGLHTWLIGVSPMGRAAG